MKRFFEKKFTLGEIADMVGELARNNAVEEAYLEVPKDSDPRMKIKEPILLVFRFRENFTDEEYDNFKDGVRQASNYYVNPFRVRGDEFKIRSIRSRGYKIKI